ncbi:MAG: hypothetical protein IPF41_06375 [Flavobacteriales bacterium]|nr:hypothetical protein [Flavobacteriales bacterium]
MGTINLVNQNQALLTKYSDTGTHLWTAVIGGSSEETGEDVALGPDGKVYITGTFKGT